MEPRKQRVPSGYSFWEEAEKYGVSGVAAGQISRKLLELLCGGWSAVIVARSRRDCSLTCHGSGGTKKGGAMSATQQQPTLVGYRDAVTDRMSVGEPFGDIEDAIDEAADLTMLEKAALWLLAFSLRDRDEQQRDARAHLAALL